MSSPSNSCPNYSGACPGYRPQVPLPLQLNWPFARMDHKNPFKLGEVYFTVEKESLRHLNCQTNKERSSEICINCLDLKIDPVVRAFEDFASLDEPLPNTNTSLYTFAQLHRKSLNDSKEKNYLRRDFHNLGGAIAIRDKKLQAYQSVVLRSYCKSRLSTIKIIG